MLHIQNDQSKEFLVNRLHKYFSCFAQQHSSEKVSILGKDVFRESKFQTTSSKNAIGRPHTPIVIAHRNQKSTVDTTSAIRSYINAAGPVRVEMFNIQRTPEIRDQARPNSQRVHHAQRSTVSTTKKKELSMNAKTSDLQQKVEYNMCFYEKDDGQSFIPANSRVSTESPYGFLDKKYPKTIPHSAKKLNGQSQDFSITENYPVTVSQMSSFSEHEHNLERVNPMEYAVFNRPSVPQPNSVFFSGYTSGNLADNSMCHGHNNFWGQSLDIHSKQSLKNLYNHPTSFSQEISTFQDSRFGLENNMHYAPLPAKQNDVFSMDSCQDRFYSDSCTQDSALDIFAVCDTYFKEQNVQASAERQSAAGSSSFYPPNEILLESFTSHQLKNSIPSYDRHSKGFNCQSSTNNYNWPQRKLQRIPCKTLTKINVLSESIDTKPIISQECLSRPSDSMRFSFSLATNAININDVKAHQEADRNRLCIPFFKHISSSRSDTGMNSPNSNHPQSFRKNTIFKDGSAVVNESIEEIVIYPTLEQTFKSQYQN